MQKAEFRIQKCELTVRSHRPHSESGILNYGMPYRRKVALSLLAAGLCVSIGSGALLARAAQQSSDDLDVVPVRPDFYMIAGAGGNVAVQLGPAGVVLVDTGSAQRTDAVLAAVRRLTSRPIRYIVNTSADADHVGGNEKLSKAGQTILGHQGSSGVSEDVYTSGGAASVLAHENVFTRMSGPASPFPFGAHPTKTYTGRSYPMYLNGDGIQIVHMPAAHSDGDSIVFFRRADVIVSGDIVDTSRFPVIDVAKGGSIQGEIDALNRLLEMMIPPFPLRWREERTFVIPGHGFVADYGDLVEYRNVVTIVRDRVQDLVGRGMTLEQVKAADPAKGFRKRYGSDSGDWTTEMFVEAVYRGLGK
jgi:glyoxylase-like metal-dependent hydrolase (beta-lactamase superfamily II)